MLVCIAFLTSSLHALLLIFSLVQVSARLVASSLVMFFFLHSFL